MTPVYHASQSDTISDLDDLILDLYPKITRLVERRYDDMSYDYRQELISSGILNVWNHARREGAGSHFVGYWFNIAKFGVKDAVRHLKYETGMYTNNNSTYVECVKYECDLPKDNASEDDLDGLELAEVH